MRQYNKRKSRFGLCAIAFLGAFACAGQAAAQDESDTPVPWAYSAYFGTGWYRLTDGRDVFVMQGTPGWTLTEPALTDRGRTIGIRLGLPVSVGFENFGVDDPTGVLDPDNVAIASVTPAVSVTIPVNDRWTLRPYGAIGWGTVIGGGDSAWTYWAGIKSRFEFATKHSTVSLVNVAGYVGNDPDDAPSDYFLPVMAGVETDIARPGWTIGDDPAFLSWHLSYTRFVNDFEVVLARGQIDRIPDQWEFGFSFGKVEKPLSAWWLEFDRLGLAYRVSSSGDLKGVALVFQSLFDR